MEKREEGYDSWSLITVMGYLIGNVIYYYVKCDFVFSNILYLA